MARHDSRIAAAAAALELLGTEQRLSYEAVAKRAGVSRQTVYTHFPRRSDLLLAAVERAREETGIETATKAVYEAATARDALRELIDVHVSFVPALLHAHLAIERERSLDPTVDEAFRTRGGGRRALARHVATRLAAEDHLASPWTVDTATDLIDAVTSGSVTTHLLSDSSWTVDDLRDRLFITLQRSLLTTDKEHP